MVPNPADFPKVKDTVGLSRSEIYRRIALGHFPKPIKLGERVVAWDADEIQAYVRENWRRGRNGTHRRRT